MSPLHPSNNSDNVDTLMVEIDQILSDEQGAERQFASFKGFCAHLACTVPQARTEFRESLEARLLREIAKTRTAPQVEGLTARRESSRPSSHLTLDRRGLGMPSYRRAAVVGGLVLAMVATFLIISSAIINSSADGNRMLTTPTLTAQATSVREGTATLRSPQRTNTNSLDLVSSAVSISFVPPARPIPVAPSGLSGRSESP